MLLFLILSAVAWLAGLMMLLHGWFGAPEEVEFEPAFASARASSPAHAAEVCPTPSEDDEALESWRPVGSTAS